MICCCLLVFLLKLGQGAMALLITHPHICLINEAPAFRISFGEALDLPDVAGQPDLIHGIEKYTGVVKTIKTSFPGLDRGRAKYLHDLLCAVLVHDSPHKSFHLHETLPKGDPQRQVNV